MLPTSYTHTAHTLYACVYVSMYDAVQSLAAAVLEFVYIYIYIIYGSTSTLCVVYMRLVS